MMPKEKEIIIADSQSISRIGLKSLCLHVLPKASVSEAATLGDLFRLLKVSAHPDLLLLNLFMGKDSALSAVSEIINLHPGINILMISDASENIYSNRVLKEGAKGFINNHEDSELIEKAISMVAEGKYFMSHELAIQTFIQTGKTQNRHNPFDCLTNKEMDIVHYLLTGMSTSEISEVTRLASSTISTYKMRIFNKLRVDNIISLSELAAGFGVV